MQQAADGRENEEAREGVARLADWRQSREVALQRRQLTEFEALLNRGALQRDELEFHKLRADQTQEARWRAATAELGHIHRSELANLELLFEGVRGSMVHMTAALGCWALETAGEHRELVGRRSRAARDALMRLASVRRLWTPHHSLAAARGPRWGGERTVAGSEAQAVAVAVQLDLAHFAQLIPQVRRFL